MIKEQVTVNVSQDVERRLATLISVAGEYSSRIYILSEDKKINAKSFMGMMSLVSYTGDTLTITVDGEDEQDAIKAVLEFFNN